MSEQNYLMKMISLKCSECCWSRLQLKLPCSFVALLTGEPMRYFADWKIDAFSVFVPILYWRCALALRLTGAKIAQKKGYFQSVKHIFAQPS